MWLPTEYFNEREHGTRVHQARPSECRSVAHQSDPVVCRQDLIALRGDAGNLDHPFGRVENSNCRAYEVDIEKKKQLRTRNDGPSVQLVRAACVELDLHLTAFEYKWRIDVWCTVCADGKQAEGNDPESVQSDRNVDIVT
jgi:hypothetical protein